MEYDEGPSRPIGGAGQAGPGVIHGNPVSADRNYDRDERMKAQINRSQAEANCSTMPGMNVREGLMQEANTLRRRATQLEELAMALPGRMTPVAEACMWDLLCRSQGR